MVSLEDETVYAFEAQIDGIPYTPTAGHDIATQQFAQAVFTDGSDAFHMQGAIPSRWDHVVMNKLCDDIRQYERIATTRTTRTGVDLFRQIRRAHQLLRAGAVCNNIDQVAPMSMLVVHLPEVLSTLIREYLLPVLAPCIVTVTNGNWAVALCAGIFRISIIDNRLLSAHNNVNIGNMVTRAVTALLSAGYISRIDTGDGVADRIVNAVTITNKWLSEIEYTRRDMSLDEFMAQN